MQQLHPYIMHVTILHLSLLKYDNVIIYIHYNQFLYALVSVRSGSVTTATTSVTWQIPSRLEWGLS